MKQELTKEIREERKRQRTFKSVPKGYRLLRFGSKVTENDLIWMDGRSRWQRSRINNTVCCSWFARKVSN